MSDNTYGEISFLKKEIRNLVGNLVDTLGDVSDYEKVGFDKFPALTITCSGNDNYFYSSAENQRTFVFTLRVYEQMEQVPKLDLVSDNAKQRAEGIVESVVDQLLNVFDTTTQFTLDGAGDNGVEAVPSRWGYALLPSGWCRVAEVELRIKRTKVVV